jgi:hypothetical protein
MINIILSIGAIILCLKAIKFSLELRDKAKKIKQNK